MYDRSTIAVILPALNEAGAIGAVLDEIPDWVDDVIVADNGSSDDTPAIAAAHGARVVTEPHRGYGSACLAGIAALGEADIVVFLDADGSDVPGEMATLLDPITAGRADMVIGSRILGGAPRDALSVQQRFGTALACGLMRLIWGVHHTDLGPFRAIRRGALKQLDMTDRDYGWTVQMQVRAARRRVRAIDVPVPYRPRQAGRSKVSRSIRGVFGAAIKIFGTIFVEALHGMLRRRTAPAARRLIVFTRYPEPGQTKTRMIPELGADGAADLQREMTRHTLNACDALGERQGVHVEVRYAGGDAPRMAELFGENRAYAPQGEGSLGDRLSRAFDHAFADGDAAAIAIGTDCPDLDASVLARAFEKLNQHDMVIGPARDGGYYLIGLRRPTRALFDGIDWGKSPVFAQTLDRARHLELRVHTLDVLDDVDRPEDLPVWHRATGDDAQQSP